MRVEVDEDEWSPGVDLKLWQADLGTVPVVDALEFRGAEELAVQLIRPSMIGTAKNACRAAAFDDCRCTVAAHVREHGQDSAGEMIARIRDPFGISDRLPRAREHTFFFEGEELRAGVPSRRNGRRAGEIRRGAIIREVHR